MNLNRGSQKIKRCTKCKIKLTLKNTIPCLRGRQHICRKCETILMCDYQRRRHVQTSINGVDKVLTGNKRPHPLDNKCELCHTSIPPLG